MKAICAVAHPDDCIIFAYSFIHAHPELDWTILYLTYTSWDSRGQELNDFWARRNIPAIFLGFKDDWRDIENKSISFDAEQAGREIKNIIQDYDIVLTHNQQGEYGHLHHVLVHESCAVHANLITFADRNTGTQLSIPAGVYTLDELPEHGEIIAGFHSQDHVNDYHIPEHVKIILADKDCK